VWYSAVQRSGAETLLVLVPQSTQRTIVIRRYIAVTALTDVLLSHNPLTLPCARLTGGNGISVYVDAAQPNFGTFTTGGGGGGYYGGASGYVSSRSALCAIQYGVYEGSTIIISN
jgi:hypothetical protein